MLHIIQISMNTCEVMMQIKHAIGKATLHRLYTNILRIDVLVLSLHFVVCVLIVVKALLNGFDPYI